MKTALLAVGTLCFMASCTPEVTSSKGIVCDASMNTVSIVTDKNDTLSFSTMDANKEEVNGLLLNDTLEVFYTGKYTPGMQATKLVQYPQSAKLGGDPDVSALPAMCGVRYKKTVSVCLKRGFVRKLPMEIMSPLSSFSAPIPLVPNYSSLTGRPMKSWRDVVYLRAVMHGM